MRNQIVDLGRFIAIIAVIIIHTSLFQFEEVDSYTFSVYVFFNQLARFAVPFFFVVSGYFYGNKVFFGACPTQVAYKNVLRVSAIFICWSLIYLLPYNITSVLDYGPTGPFKLSYWSVLNVVERPFMFFLEGSKAHLWFLPSLALSIILTSLFLKFRAFGALACLSVLSFLIGVLAKAYSDTPIGIELDWDTRNGHFFAWVFFVTGVFLSSREFSENSYKLGVILFLAGGILHYGELHFLHTLYSISYLQDYVFGTYFMGVGFAIIFLSLKNTFPENSLSNLGRLTLGVYASHFIFVDLAEPLRQLASNVFFEVLRVLFVVSCSFIFTYLLAQNRRLKKLVT